LEGVVLVQTRTLPGVPDLLARLSARRGGKGLKRLQLLRLLLLRLERIPLVPPHRVLLQLRNNRCACLTWVAIVATTATVLIPVPGVRTQVGPQPPTTPAVAGRDNVAVAGRDPLCVKREVLAPFSSHREAVVLATPMETERLRWRLLRRNS